MAIPSDPPVLLPLPGGVLWGSVLLSAPPDKEQSRQLTRRFADAYFARLHLPSDRVLYQDSGKPVFERAPHFLSVTHSENFFAFCAAPVPCGIDAERSGRNAPAVARRFFSPAEQERDFAAVWTAKEAVSKISGEGLAAIRKIAVEQDRALGGGDRFCLHTVPTHGFFVTVAVKEV